MKICNFSGKYLLGILILIVLTLFNESIFCQDAINKVDIRFKIIDEESTDKVVCIAVQLKATDNVKIALSSQNYRMFYDESAMEYLPEKLATELSPENYELTQNYVNMTKARSIKRNEGVYSGYLDFGIISKQKDNETVEIVAHKWINSLKMYFNVLSDVLKMNWCIEGMGKIRTAGFVRLSEWKTKSITEDVQINTWGNLDHVISNTGLNIVEESSVSYRQPQVFPNPAVSQISIFGLEDDIEKVEVVSLHTGKKYSLNAGFGNTSGNYDVSSLPQGSYLVRGFDKNGRVKEAKFQKIDL